MQANFNSWRYFLRSITILGFVIGIALPNFAEPAHGQRGIAATGHPLATDAAINAFQRGGNAIDAAIAAALTLGVVDGHNSGLGGGCLILIRLANGRTIAIDGREVAPLAAQRNMYVRDGRVDPRLSQFGALSIAVPGALMAYAHASDRYGRLKFRDQLLVAARLAEAGFPIDAHYARLLETHASELNTFEPTRAIFLRPDGTSRTTGDILRQPDLATTYRSIAASGTDWFYGGPFATAASDWVVRNGGILSIDDFLVYQARLREPVVSTYRGHTILGFPPPSSGGIAVAEILNIVETFDVKRMSTNSADVIHVVSEALKLAFADRAYWMGDADFVKIPPGLIAKSYATNLAKQIQMDRVTPVTRHGSPAGAQRGMGGRQTTHFSTADAAGNWVACTATINTTFGSKIVIPGTGVLMNNEMDDFAIQPGVSNYFGLIGAEANTIAPRKRPLSSMSPTIVLKNGRPIMSVGAAGGPTIISQVALALIHAIDFGLDLETAQSQPRFHHQWRPDELRIENAFGDPVLRELEKRGHKVVPVDVFGVAQAIGVHSAQRAFVGVADPRAYGKAAGW